MAKSKVREDYSCGLGCFTVSSVIIGSAACRTHNFVMSIKERFAEIDSDINLGMLKGFVVGPERGCSDDRQLVEITRLQPVGRVATNWL